MNPPDRQTHAVSLDAGAKRRRPAGVRARAKRARLTDPEASRRFPLGVIPAAFLKQLRMSVLTLVAGVNQTRGVLSAPSNGLPTAMQMTLPTHH